MKKYVISLIASIGLSLAPTAYAGDIQVEVTDSKGNKLKDAVVYLESENTNKIPATKKAQIAQKNKTFLPLVSIIQTGTAVEFPNNDSFRHHVYSFSPAKKFDLKLYSGVPATPVIFDKAGTVVLGCNIHDSMLAYIYVVDTPFATKSDTNGFSSIPNIPNGKYRLSVQHYAQIKSGTPYEKNIEITDSTNKLLVVLDVDQKNLIN